MNETKQVYLSSLIVALIFGAASIWVFRSFVGPLFTEVFHNILNDETWNWSGLFFLFPFLFLSPAANSISRIGLWILSSTTFIPFLVLAPYLTSLSTYDRTLVQFIVSALLLTSILVTENLQLELKKARPEKAWHKWILIASIALMVIVTIVFFGVKPIPTTFLQMAEHREQFKANLGSSTSFAAYAYTLLKGLVVSLLILFGLDARKWRLVATGLVLGVYLYSVAGEKSVLFSPLAFLPFYLMIRYPFRYTGILIPVLVLGMIGAALYVDRLTESNVLNALFVRRTIMIPSAVAWYYFDTFWNFPPFAYSDGSLSWIFQNPFPYSSPAQAIGVEVFKNPLTHANGAFFADAFVHAKFIGIGLAGIAFIGALLACNAVWRRCGNNAVIGATFLLILMKAGATGIQTVFASNGLVLLLIVTYLFSYSLLTNFSRKDCDN